MNIDNIKELLLVITPFIVTLGGVISALFVKIYNAKNNYKALKEEITKLNEETQKRQIKHTEELAKRDIIIKDLKEQLAQALSTIELLKSKIETKSGNPYLLQLEASNEEYKKVLSKQLEIIKQKDLEINELKTDVKTFAIEIEKIKSDIQTRKEQEIENLNNKNKDSVKATIY